MALRRFVILLALTALALPSFVSAQHEHRATVLTRGGDRIAGVVEDVERGVVYVRVSLHDQRKLPVGDVALIDFVGGATGLPDTEINMARGGQHVAFLRNGSNWQGEFVDIRGGETDADPNEPHLLIFRANGEERRIGLDQVGRVYLGNFPGGTTVATTPTPAPSEPIPAGAIRVPGNATWVATPLVVRRGDRVSFTTTGQVQLSDDAGDVAISAGSLRQRQAGGAPMPQHLAGALIAKVGNSAPFAIGNNTAPITMPANGQLYLGINDDEVSDNRGEFVVTLHHQALSRRR